MTNKWFRFNQNNSGGYFHDDENVTHDVFVEAPSAKEAIQRAEVIFENYSDYCDCCGERWGYWVDDEDGKLVPESYGIPVTECESSPYQEHYILYPLIGKHSRHDYPEQAK